MRGLILALGLLLLRMAPVMAASLPLVTGNNYAPFTDETLPQRGMITEIVMLSFQKSGYEANIDFRPWKRGYEETKSGQFAGTFPYIKTEERMKDFYYSQPIHTTYTRVFVTEDSPIRTPEDLKGKRICIPLGYAINKELDRFLSENIIRQQDNPVNLEGCLRMLSSDRKDFFVINEINGWMTIKKSLQNKETFRTLDKVFQEESHYLIIPKSYPNGKTILTHFNQGLQRLKEEGLLDEIFSRHLKGIID